MLSNKDAIIIFGLLSLFACPQCNKKMITYKESSEYANFVKIIGGVYTVGTPKSEHKFNKEGDEENIRKVKINDFLISRYEVTQELYEKIMGEHASSFSGKNFPVDNVTWYNAVEFCNRLSVEEGLLPAYTIYKDIKDLNNNNIFDEYRYLVEWNKEANGYRLPTSDEWEIACRAGSKTVYNTGKKIKSNQANFGLSNKDAAKHILPVGCFKPNAWGLYDMHGNVYEWCWDLLNNMVRVIRGGSWDSEMYQLRSGAVTGTIPTSVL